MYVQYKVKNFLATVLENKRYFHGNSAPRQILYFPRKKVFKNLYTHITQVSFTHRFTSDFLNLLAAREIYIGYMIVIAIFYIVTPHYALCIQFIHAVIDTDFSFFFFFSFYLLLSYSLSRKLFNFYKADSM